MELKVKIKLNTYSTHCKTYNKHPGACMIAPVHCTKSEVDNNQ